MNQDLVQSNKKGCCYLEQRDFRNALICFRHALSRNLECLRLLEENERNAIHGSHGNSDVDATTLVNHQHNRGSFPQIELDPRTALLGLEAEKSSSSNIKSNLFLHSHGIAIDVVILGSQQLNSRVQLSVIGSTILFNLATVYHLKAIEECAFGRAKLEKALSLYLKSSSLLQDCGILVGSSTGSAIIDLLVMALSNNLAHISFELCDYEKSRKYFGQLVSFSSSILPHIYQDPRIGALIHHYKSSFLLNAIALQAPTLASAA